MGSCCWQKESFERGLGSGCDTMVPDVARSTDVSFSWFWRLPAALVSGEGQFPGSQTHLAAGCPVGVGGKQREKTLPSLLIRALIPSPGLWPGTLLPPPLRAGTSLLCPLVLPVAADRGTTGRASEAPVPFLRTFRKASAIVSPCCIPLGYTLGPTAIPTGRWAPYLLSGHRLSMDTAGHAAMPRVPFAGLPWPPHPASPLKLSPSLPAGMAELGPYPLTAVSLKLAIWQGPRAQCLRAWPVPSCQLTAP